MTRRAIIVVDLGFGDAGKGTMTDHLVRHTGATTVVRFNGGAQAGHTVVLPDGRCHTFSQIGAGSFVPGVRTHLSSFMVVHPGGLLGESSVLESKGVQSILERVSIAPRARVITPFQQAANRLREVLRGDSRHGSCGLGIGETMADELEHPEECVRAGDLAHPHLLRPKLLRIQQRKWELFAHHHRQLRLDPHGRDEMAVLESAEVTERFIALCQSLALRVEIADLDLSARGSLIFEGAQGVLLDEWRGFHPHTTWSTCTPDNALSLLSDWDGEVSKLGVLRTYATRHGAGPFPTESAEVSWSEPHNHLGPWQGAFRQGYFDAVLARYAIACCGGLDGLAVTHLDRVGSDFLFAERYSHLADEFGNSGQLRLGPYRDLDFQQRLGAALAAARPVYGQTVADDVCETLERCLQTPIVWESHGPLPHNKRARFQAEASRIGGA